jgi:hypothetical protein
MLKFCLCSLTPKEKVVLKGQTAPLFLCLLFSAQALPGFFHGFTLAGEELADEEIGNLPETVDGTVFYLLVATHNGILHFPVSVYDAVFHFPVMMLLHVLHLSLS